MITQTKPADENDAPECNADEGEEEDEEGGLKIGNDRFGDVPSSVLGHGVRNFLPQCLSTLRVKDILLGFRSLCRGAWDARYRPKQIS